MKPVSFTCLALSSAGRVPEYGRNEFHVYNGRTEVAYGWFCSEAKVTAATIGGGPEFSAHHWNRQHSGNKLDAPDGWRWGELHVERAYMGGSERIVDKHFVGFHTAHPDIYAGDCIIDRPRYLHDLQIFDLTKRAVFDLSLPVYKGALGSYAYAMESSCTDGTKWPVLHVRVTTAKHAEAFRALVA